MPQKTIYLHLNTRDEFLRIDVSKIAYFEGDGNYTHIVSANGLRSTVGMNLARMQEMLTERLREHARIFVRVGKKHIVNHTYLYHINVPRQKLTLSDGAAFVFTIEVSKEALRKLKDFYLAADTRAAASTP